MLRLNWVLFIHCISQGAKEQRWIYKSIVSMVENSPENGKVVP
jgi:hypothetical protein